MKIQKPISQIDFTDYPEPVINDPDFTPIDWSGCSLRQSETNEDRGMWEHMFGVKYNEPIPDDQVLDIDYEEINEQKLLD